jgi:uncharacterized cupin superfamily protein
MMINKQDLDWGEYDYGENYFRRKELSNVVDAEEIGCSLYELPPGKRSWPYHYHTSNEEALFVLAGMGQLRTANGEKQLKHGDFATLPASKEGGHQVINDGDEPLRYLMVSTMNEPDVTVYPEMEKIGVFVGSPPGGRDERSLHRYYNIDDDTDYWEERDDD